MNGISRRILAIGCAAALAASFALAGCAGGGGAVSYKDGTYTGQSEVYEDSDDGNGNGYGVATVTIKDGAITDCTFETYELDGNKKDENYGVSLSGNQNKYTKAQNAVKACPEYAKALVEAGSLDGVDTISGATVNYDQFCEAVDDALAQARA